MSTSTAAPGWHPDPWGRYEYRWWDGSSWTNQVSRSGQVTQDEIDSAPAPDRTTSTDQPSAAVHSSSPGGGATSSPALQVQSDVKVTAFNAKKVAGQLLQENRGLRQEVATLRSVVDQFGGLEAAEVARRTEQLRTTETDLTQQVTATRTELDQIRDEVVVNRDRVELESEFGIYDYEHPAEASATLATDLEAVRAQIKATNKTGIATVATTNFTYNNSSAKGRTFVGQMSRIMLRWYNAEAESAVKSVKAGNLESALKRLTKVQEQVAKQGRMIDLTITADYHQLRLRELELAARHLQAVAAEKEREREYRAQLREQRVVEAEIAKEKERLAKERAHYVNSIQRLRDSGDEAAAVELEAKLAAIDEEIAQADYRAANIRAGYVYVISNVGAFGEQVVKIGMTRRLEPMDRIRELGDASVPFRFDVHALFFSDDAVGVETMLHRTFAAERLNKVNLRREFFRVSPDRVLQALQTHDVAVLEFRLEAAADEYRASRPGEAFEAHIPTP
ncbi:DUF4041 domain-containing protein [Luteipulveratus mongoliensis]|uniref:Bacteriophage T5 Orf172 DNA-binding domain-containing protein n=1 Tax=Luteipulveratus mongoliensis TaxID=571913 RepID=A0A0K1JDU5_9MICO|nr:DUF4041 domain-containing protein [Luteipulveratus mongoliensis]AKU14763.1 hypothetical protein VV02_00845 [Luteipulveratus mongoliensis]